MIATSILDWEHWPAFRPYCHATIASRTRIEITPIPHEERQLRRAALTLQVPCPSCQYLHHPIRERADGSWYYAASCHTEDNYRCSRSRNVHHELTDVANDLLGRPPERVTFEQISFL